MAISMGLQIQINRSEFLVCPGTNELPPPKNRRRLVISGVNRIRFTAFIISRYLMEAGNCLRQASARTFEEFVGAMRGALFTAGLNAFKPLHQSISVTFQAILATWVAWQAFLCAQREDFIPIEVDDLHMTRFEIL